MKISSVEGSFYCNQWIETLGKGFSTGTDPNINSVEYSNPTIWRY
jgi:hypothetical protein